MLFDRYVGIDYSGAKAPESCLKALQIFAGIPWLHDIRQRAGDPVHFWPFDGWDLPEGKPVILEAYPALCKRRYPRNGRTPDEHDACSLAAWLRDMDARGALDRYSRPPLTPAEKETAALEGWIFGVG